MAGLKYWVWLSALTDVTAQRKLRLLEELGSPENIYYAEEEELSQIDGVGAVIAGTFCDYFRDEKHKELVEKLLKELTIAVETVEEGSQILTGKSFAITGSLEYFENRNQLKEKIESMGGKVTGSVTGKTFALINNDAASNSSKNKKARELGVQIITEKEFVEKYMEK